MTCLALAVGLDFVEGLEPGRAGNPYLSARRLYPSLDPWSERRFGTGAEASLRHFSKSLEESLEMGAMSLLWFVLLGLLGQRARDVRLTSRE